MHYFLSSFAKSIVIVIIVIIIIVLTRDERVRETREREKSLRENFMKIEHKTRRHIVTKKPQNIELLLYYYRMLFTSSATFVGAFAGVCTQMYACALRKVPLFHREYCSPFLLCLLCLHHHHRFRRVAQSSLFPISRASLSLSFICIKHTR